jgi:hypothetical protein
MTVAELIRELKTCPQNLPVALSVYSHHYGSGDHVLTHGDLGLIVGRANGISESVWVGQGLDYEIECGRIARK